MRAIQVLSALLALQLQAQALGAPVRAQVRATEAALCRELRSVRRPSVLPRMAPPEERRLLERVSSWDPEPVDSAVESSRCRALLLEVIRRAVHDWVLYQGTRKMEREYAEDAYIWLFEEEPGHPWYEARVEAGEQLMAFVDVCEALDLEPEVVRAHVRKMTVKDILGMGRPADRRRKSADVVTVEDYTSPSCLDEIDAHDGNNYEAHFSVPGTSFNSR